MEQIPLTIRACAIWALVIMVSGLFPQSSSFVKIMPSAARFSSIFSLRRSRLISIFSSMAASTGSFWSTKSPRIWISVPSKLLDTSIPGITSILRSRPFSNASGTPAVVSWSVRAKASRPAFFASSTTWVGVKVPSEASEWTCRSTKPMVKTSLVFLCSFYNNNTNEILW